MLFLPTKFTDGVKIYHRGVGGEFSHHQENWSLKPFSFSQHESFKVNFSTTKLTVKVDFTMTKVVILGCDLTGGHQLYLVSNFFFLKKCFG